MKYLIFIFWILDTENALKKWVVKSVSKSKILKYFTSKHYDIGDSYMINLINTLRRRITKPKVIKCLPEADIMVTLKDFGITKEDMEYTMRGFTAVNKNSVTILDNGEVVFKQEPEKLILFENTEKVKSALKELFPEKLILEVALKDISNHYILDVTDYNSMKNTYEIANSAGVNISNDKELIDYALNKMVPRKRVVKGLKHLGKKAFEGSNVYEYNLNYLICYDKDLILAIRTITEKTK